MDDEVSFYFGNSGTQTLCITGRAKKVERLYHRAAFRLLHYDHQFTSPIPTTIGQFGKFILLGLTNCQFFYLNSQPHKTFLLGPFGFLEKVVLVLLG